MSRHSPDDITQGYYTPAFRRSFCHEVNWTDLHWAAYKKDDTTVRQLLVNGKDINIIDKYGNSPLHLACRRNNNAKCIETLLKFNPDINLRDYSLNTALNLIVRETTYGEKLIRQFFSLGADPDLPDLKGNTPLHHVALTAKSARHVGLTYARALIENKANVNLTNDEGDTPLHLAILECFEGLIELLIQNGAYIHIKNHFGYTQFDVASLLIYSFPNIHEYIGKHYILQYYCKRIPLNLQHLKQLIKVENLRVFKNKCFMEYLELKTSNIGQSVIKYSDILTKPLNALAKDMQGVDVLWSVMNVDVGKYEVFGSQLSINLKKALERYYAIEMGYSFLHKSMAQWDDSEIDKLLDNLSNEDLYKLKFLEIYSKLRTSTKF